MAFICIPPTLLNLPRTSRVTHSKPPKSNLLHNLRVRASAQNFEWLSQWYPIAPVYDLDKRIPHAHRVMGINMVIWWDWNDSDWKAFDDCCPHRLAPLSEGRIDQWSRLQCVYHGWCFSGSGDCDFIPQSPPDSPVFHRFKKACVASYPCTVQNGFVWFWPNSDPHYKDIITKKTPPQLHDHPNSLTYTTGMRDLPYGYEVLVENLSDPAHINYAHYGIISTPTDNHNRVVRDREGGKPMEISVEAIDVNGFIAVENSQEKFKLVFVAPCLLSVSYSSQIQVDGSWIFSRGDRAVKSSNCGPKFNLVFLCIPVSPGKSRFIWSIPSNVAGLFEKIVPRWIFHLEINLVLDSDLYLLHMQEQRLVENGVTNWKRSYFTPTKSDTMVVTFRKWLTKYSGGQLNWGNNLVPPTPTRRQLMDRYWSHVKNCKSCSGAYKWLKMAKMVLQVMSLWLVGVAATTTFEAKLKGLLVLLAVLCFLGSNLVSRFVYKSFHYHDYNHACV